MYFVNVYLIKYFFHLNFYFIIINIRMTEITNPKQQNLDYGQLLKKLSKRSSKYNITVITSLKENKQQQSSNNSDIEFKQKNSQSNQDDQFLDKTISIRVPCELQQQLLGSDQFLERQLSRGVQTDEQYQNSVNQEQKQLVDQNEFDQLLRSCCHLSQLRQFQKLTQLLYKFKHKYTHINERILYKWNLAMGNCKRQQKQYGQAIKCFQQCVEIFDTYDLGFSELKHANFLNILGLTYMKVCQWSLAAAAFSSALQIFEKQNNIKQFANTLNNMGSLYLQIGMLEQAVQLLTQAYRIKIRLLGKQSLDTFSTLFNLAEGNKLLGQYDQAQKILKHMRILGSQGNNFLVLAQINRRLGILQHLRGREAQAQIYYDISRQILQQNHSKEQLQYGYLLHDTGRLNVDIGEMKAARKFFDQANRLYNIYLSKQSHRKIVLQRNFDLIDF